jgi:hypothetical protein
VVTSPDLTKSETQAELKHSSGILPNLVVNMKVMKSEIVNIKWSWKRDSTNKLPEGIREPYEIPNDIVDTNLDLSTTPLSKYLVVNETPFTLKVVNDGATLFSIDGFIYDQYLNWIKATAMTASGS